MSSVLRLEIFLPINMKYPDVFIIVLTHWQSLPLLSAPPSRPESGWSLPSPTDRPLHVCVCVVILALCDLQFNYTREVFSRTGAGGGAAGVPPVPVETGPTVVVLRRLFLEHARDLGGLGHLPCPRHLRTVRFGFH